MIDIILALTLYTTAHPKQLNETSVANYVARLAVHEGWTQQQIRAMHALIEYESGYRVSANNPTSSAWGLFQLLKMPEGTPIDKQFHRFARYINHRYSGDVRRAWQHIERHGWY